MTVVLVAVGALWGGWLGRREAAHIGVGIGTVGLVAGTVLGGAVGYVLGLVAWWAVLAAVIALASATAVIVSEW